MVSVSSDKFVDGDVFLGAVAHESIVDRFLVLRWSIELRVVGDLSLLLAIVTFDQMVYIDPGSFGLEYLLLTIKNSLSAGIWILAYELLQLATYLLGFTKMLPGSGTSK